MAENIFSLTLLWETAGSFWPDLKTVLLIVLTSSRAFQSK